jgi:Family of unknown function (DUF6496)
MLSTSVLSGKKKPSKTQRLVGAAMKEVHENVPKNVTKTGKTGKAAEKMKVAIGLSKARAAGAKVPLPKK